MESPASYLAGSVEPAGQPDHGIELEQGERRGRVVQVHLPGLDLRFQCRRQRVGVHFEPDCQRGLGLTPGPTPPFFCPATAW